MIINATFDTVTKILTVTSDGADVPDVNYLRFGLMSDMNPLDDDEQEFSMSLVQRKIDKASKTATETCTYATEATTGLKTVMARQAKARVLK